jgi:RimJ/RimL family protein N-acetyltransferase
MVSSELQSPRLILRQWTPEDARFLYQLNLDPQVLEYTGDGAFESVHDARTFIENYRQYQLHGFGRWLIVRHADGAKLGWCGLRRADNRLEVDLGFRLAQEYWGQGYASEAALACLKYGHQYLEIPEIIARTHRSNLRSQRVLERIGMHFEGECAFDSEPGYWYRSTYPS